MKVKLIKSSFDGWNHYYLKNENGDTIGTTKHPFPPEMVQMAKGKGIELIRLSLKNCQAIERGYDLDELVEKHIKEWEYERLLGSGSSTLAHDNFVMGFQKALEILGDKKFGEGELKQSLWDLGDVLFNNCQNGIKEGEPQKYIDSIIQSLQQNEWDVEIVMESCFYDDSLGGFSTSYKEGMPTEKPKLDPNGCLILKRIEYA